MRIYRAFADQVYDKYIKQFELFPVDPEASLTMTLSDYWKGQDHNAVYSLNEDSQPEDENIIVKIDTNANFEAGGNRLSLQVRNKDQVAYQGSVPFGKGGAQTLFYEIPLSKVYEVYPNGGVFILKLLELPEEENGDDGDDDYYYYYGSLEPVEDTGLIDLERLIFLVPQNTIDFEIETDQSAYQPGGQVTLTVTAAGDAAD